MYHIITILIFILMIYYWLIQWLIRLWTIYEIYGLFIAYDVADSADTSTLKWQTAWLAQDKWQ